MVTTMLINTFTRKLRILQAATFPSKTISNSIKLVINDFCPTLVPLFTIFWFRVSQNERLLNCECGNGAPVPLEVTTCAYYGFRSRIYRKPSKHCPPVHWGDFPAVTGQIDTNKRQTISCGKGYFCTYEHSSTISANTNERKIVHQILSVT